MTAYQVLARKWRPKTFADLVGQQHVVKALQNALDKGRLHHAYLLTGTRGVGKTTIARILAKSLNCETPNHGEPCGVCQSCRDIDAGRFVDLLEIDAASNTGIDNIREVLENAQYAPTVGKYKVYIIDEVHMLSKSAFNAMLKTLEEPPEHVKFILATTDPHKVPITVLSRCLQFVLRNMTAQQVAEHLAHVLKTEQIVYEPAALALLGRAAQGSMRDALSLLDQAIAMGSGSVQEHDVRDMIGAVDKRYLYELLTFLMEQDGENLIAKAQEMSANAIGFDSSLNDLAMLLQRLALLKTVPSAIEHDDPERERLLHLAQYFSDEQIQLYYQCVIHGKNDLPLAPDEYAGFVMTLLRMLAFAPFAAKSTPHNATIEGTQLHSLPESETAKSPPIAEKTVSGSLKNDEIVKKTFNQSELPPPSPQEIRRSSKAIQAAENVVSQDESVQTAENIVSQDESIQAAENIVSQDESVQAAENIVSQDESVQTAESVVSQDESVQAAENVVSQDESVQTAENIVSQDESVQIAENVVSQDESVQTAENIVSQDESIQTSENIVSQDESVQAAETRFAAPSPTPPETSARAWDDEPTYYGDYDFDNLPTTPPSALPETTPPPKTTLPPPEWASENWFHITSHIAPEVGAAQMMLRHLAWLDWDGCTLTLALPDNKTAQNTEYIKRIEQALSHAYHKEVRVAIAAWQPEMGVETPNMRNQRIAAERLAQAKAHLNNSPVAQKLQSLFKGKWRDDTIELKLS
ncbi:DNA polymerase-3 subunit gamma/tau [Alysiella filiformis DSM 16848]|uniref:DNA polymerase III subunit gamma/tau n=1 Tax=Alysiella filiformis DSM 16848 TaxID=1120981 RepID=A0A286E5G2_9NEIS|nr:DNA polymerase III subunit gamma/tau [Alysiella filiformis]SOD66133.1 DNA polymerase-3 subunit gamma/tau [Alysiella filiformis DSM 16848]